MRFRCGIGATMSAAARTIHRAMDDLHGRPSGDWSDEEIARDAAAARARAKRDRQAGAAANVTGAAALARFANRVAEAAEVARRDERARS
jgi:hypothetical protein